MRNVVITVFYARGETVKHTAGVGEYSDGHYCFTIKKHSRVSLIPYDNVREIRIEAEEEEEQNA